MSEIFINYILNTQLPLNRQIFLLQTHTVLWWSNSSIGVGTVGAGVAIASSLYRKGKISYKRGGIMI